MPLSTGKAAKFYLGIRGTRYCEGMVDSYLEMGLEFGDWDIEVNVEMLEGC